MTPEQLEEVVRHAQRFISWRANLYELAYAEPETALVWCHLREINRRGIILLARAGWEVAHVLLHEMAKFLTNIGDYLPIWLQEYVVFEAPANASPRKKRRGRDPLTNLVRDMVIQEAIDMVSKTYDLDPTRNPGTTDDESGSSIVEKALEGSGAAMTEANVNAIWAKRGISAP